MTVLAIGLRKTELKIEKPACLGISILDKKKIAMYWYDYIKKNCEGNTKHCYMGIDSFIVYVKTAGIYADIAQDVKTRFDTYNCDIQGPLPIGKNKKVKDLTNNKLGGRTMTEFIAQRPFASFGFCYFCVIYFFHLIKYIQKSID